VGGGELAVELEMSKWEEKEPEEGEEPLKLAELIHIQEVLLKFSIKIIYSKERKFTMKTNTLFYGWYT